MNLIGVFLAIKHARAYVPTRRAHRLHRPVAASPGAGGGLQREQGRRYQSHHHGSQLSRRRNVRVNAPALASSTGMTRLPISTTPSSAAQKTGSVSSTLKRYGVPRKSHKISCFLRATRASYVNGQHIAVDGGLTSSMPVTGGSEDRAKHAV